MLEEIFNEILGTLCIELLFYMRQIPVTIIIIGKIYKHRTIQRKSVESLSSTT